MGIAGLCSERKRHAQLERAVITALLWEENSSCWEQEAGQTLEMDEAQPSRTSRAAVSVFVISVKRREQCTIHLSHIYLADVDLSYPDVPYDLQFLNTRDLLRATRQKKKENKSKDSTLIMLLHRFRTGHEPLPPQGLKVTCKENEESVPGCSKTMHCAAKKKDVGFGENNCDLEGKQTQRPCRARGWQSLQFASRKRRQEVEGGGHFIKVHIFVMRTAPKSPAKAEEALRGCCRPRGRGQPHRRGVND